MLVSAITVLIVCLAAPLVWFWLTRTFMLAFFSAARFEAQMEADRKMLARLWQKLLGFAVGEVDDQAGR